MTLFGGGFFVQPNTIDFDYVFKYADFSDNTTIYATVLICLATFLLLLLWAKWQDTRDMLVSQIQKNFNQFFPIFFLCYDYFSVF